MKFHFILLTQKYIPRDLSDIWVAALKVFTLLRIKGWDLMMKLHLQGSSEVTLPVIHC